MMRPTAGSDDEAVAGYLAEMQRHNIVLAVGSGPLEMTRRMQAKAGRRFLAGMEFPRLTLPINQRRETWPDTGELLGLFQDGRLQIMGEITAQYAGLAPNDPKLEPYFALAERLDVPVCLHTGFGPPMSPYMGDPGFRMRYGNPLLLEDVLVRHPRLRIYIAHGGYPFLSETIALMLMYRQVYADISAINWLLTKDELRTYLKRLVDARLGKRILFGTDQMIWPETVGMAVAAIESADYLTADQKRDIFFNNAVDFLRLEASDLLAAGANGRPGAGVARIKVISTELRMRPAKVGDEQSASCKLDLAGVKSAAIQVTGFDLDGPTEALMLVNGREFALPESMVADMAPRTATIQVPEGVLRQGENLITFRFADAVGGTTGFSILAVTVLLTR